MRHLVCITEAGYRGALTRGASYEVIALDDGARQFRIRDDRGRSRWYPAFCFADATATVARLAAVQLDDPVDHPTADWIEVTLTLTDGRRRWCAFTTPATVALRGEALGTDGQAFRAFFGAPHVVIVTQLSEPIIATTLDHLDRQGLIEACTLELDASAG
jgi:hypothetical protein